MALADLRYALRVLRLRPGSSAAIILTLALAIGANSALFTLINAALLAPLPVEHPDRLVNVYTTGIDGTGYGGLSYPDFQDLRSANSALDDALGYSGLMTTVTDGRSSEVVFGELVTPNYFSLLGVKLQLGRGFEASEGERGAQAGVVIGDRLWRRRFNADPSIIGNTISLNGRPYSIVGVAPRVFGGLLFRAISADVWAPVSMMGALRTDQRDNRSERWMFVKGRLKVGASVADASAASAVIASRLQAVYPASNKGRTFRVLSSSDVIVHPDGDRAVFAASGAVMTAALLVLIVACANIAGIMLARGLARQREVAIRLSIGARRSDVIRQLLVESTLLSMLGGMGGLLVAGWFATVLASWRPELPVPISLNTVIDSRVTLFTLAVTVAATMCFALVPAFRTSRAAPAGSMRQVAARSRRRLFGLRDAVLIPQLAIAIGLISVAGLLVRSLSSADRVSPGFDLDHTAYVSLNLSMSGYDDERAHRFYDRLTDSLEQRGIIKAAAITSRVPLDLYGNQSASVSIGPDSTDVRLVQIAQVGAGYFDAMGITILRGRGLGSTGRTDQCGADRRRQRGRRAPVLARGRGRRPDDSIRRVERGGTSRGRGCGRQSADARRAACAAGISTPGAWSCGPASSGCSHVGSAGGEHRRIAPRGQRSGSDGCRFRDTNDVRASGPDALPLSFGCWSGERVWSDCDRARGHRTLRSTRVRRQRAPARACDSSGARCAGGDARSIGRRRNGPRNRCRRRARRVDGPCRGSASCGFSFRHLAFRSAHALGHQHHPYRRRRCRQRRSAPACLGGRGRLIAETAVGRPSAFARSALADSP